MNPFFIKSPQMAPYYESFLSPVHTEYKSVQSNTYVEGEDFPMYLPIQFNILSIVLNTIDRYNNIEISKWIGFGYKMPLNETFINTRKFLASLPEQYLYKLQTEDIEPTPYGTFVLDFISDDDKVSIEIGKDKVGYFTKYSHKENIVSTGIALNENNVPEEIIEALEGILA